MFSKTILALAALATIGAALVTSTSSADARGFSRGGFKGFKGGAAHARFTPDRPNRPNWNPHRPNLPHWHPRRPHGHWHVRWQRPLIYGVGVATAAVAAPVYAAPAAPRPCTCLTKEYTPDNLVVFKDLCTKEMAAAPIGGEQQQTMLAPQPGQAEPIPQR